MEPRVLKTINGPARIKVRSMDQLLKESPQNHANNETSLSTANAIHPVWTISPEVTRGISPSNKTKAMASGNNTRSNNQHASNATKERAHVLPVVNNNQTISKQPTTSTAPLVSKIKQKSLRNPSIEQKQNKSLHNSIKSRNVTKTSKLNLNTNRQKHMTAAEKKILARAFALLGVKSPNHINLNKINAITDTAGIRSGVKRLLNNTPKTNKVIVKPKPIQTPSTSTNTEEVISPGQENTSPPQTEHSLIAKNLLLEDNMIQQEVNKTNNSAKKRNLLALKKQDYFEVPIVENNFRTPDNPLNSHTINDCNKTDVNPKQTNTPNNKSPISHHNDTAGTQTAQMSQFVRQIFATQKVVIPRNSIIVLSPKKPKQTASHQNKKNMDDPHNSPATNTKQTSSPQNKKNMNSPLNMPSGNNKQTDCSKTKKNMDSPHNVPAANTKQAVSSPKSTKMEVPAANTHQNAKESNKSNTEQNRTVNINNTSKDKVPFVSLQNGTSQNLNKDSLAENLESTVCIVSDDDEPLPSHESVTNKETANSDNFNSVTPKTVPTILKKSKKRVINDDKTVTKDKVDDKSNQNPQIVGPEQKKIKLNTLIESITNFFKDASQIESVDNKEHDDSMSTQEANSSLQSFVVSDEEETTDIGEKELAPTENLAIVEIIIPESPEKDKSSSPSSQKSPKSDSSRAQLKFLDKDPRSQVTESEKIYEQQGNTESLGDQATQDKNLKAKAIDSHVDCPINCVESELTISLSKNQQIIEIPESPEKDKSVSPKSNKSGESEPKRGSRLNFLDDSRSSENAHEMEKTINTENTNQVSTPDQNLKARTDNSDMDFATSTPTQLPEHTEVTDKTELENDKSKRKKNIIRKRLMRRNSKVSLARWITAIEKRRLDTDNRIADALSSIAASLQHITNDITTKLIDSNHSIIELNSTLKDIKNIMCQNSKVNT